MVSAVIYLLLFAFLTGLVFFAVYVGLRGKKSLIFFVVVDFSLLVYGGYELQKTLRFTHRALPMEGQLLSLSCSYHSPGSTVVSNSQRGSEAISVGGYCRQIAHIKYVPQGASREVLTWVPWKGSQAAGQKIRLLYDPKNRDHVASASFWDLWSDAFIAFFFAMSLGTGIFVSHTLGISFKNSRKKKEMEKAQGEGLGG